jgi:hypothetical protein
MRQPVLTSFLGTCLLITAPAGAVEKAAEASSAKSYSPYAGRVYPTQVFWGDTHLHTALSVDAAACGNQLGLDEARGIEIPTPRWTAYDAVRHGVKMPDQAPMTTQERAYTSPIWYTP